MLFSGSIFHLLASYPSSKDFNDISSSMSSSLILLKEHIDSISILKLQVPSEEQVLNVSSFSLNGMEVKSKFAQEFLYYAFFC